jgi:hypothetical protein
MVRLHDNGGRFDMKDLQSKTAGTQADAAIAPDNVCKFGVGRAWCGVLDARVAAMSAGDLHQGFGG